MVGKTFTQEELKRKTSAELYEIYRSRGPSCREAFDCLIDVENAEFHKDWPFYAALAYKNPEKFTNGNYPSQDILKATNYFLQTDEYIKIRGVTPNAVTDELKEIFETYGSTFSNSGTVSRLAQFFQKKQEYQYAVAGLFKQIVLEVEILKKEKDTKVKNNSTSDLTGHLDFLINRINEVVSTVKFHFTDQHSVEIALAKIAELVQQLPTSEPEFKVYYRDYFDLTIKYQNYEAQIKKIRTNINTLFKSKILNSENSPNQTSSLPGADKPFPQLISMIDENYDQKNLVKNYFLIHDNLNSLDDKIACLQRIFALTIEVSQLDTQYAIDVLKTLAENHQYLPALITLTQLLTSNHPDDLTHDDVLNLYKQFLDNPGNNKEVILAYLQLIESDLEQNAGIYPPSFFNEISSKIKELQHAIEPQPTLWPVSENLQKALLPEKSLEDLIESLSSEDDEPKEMLDASYVHDEALLGKITSGTLQKEDFDQLQNSVGSIANALNNARSATQIVSIRHIVEAFNVIRNFLLADTTVFSDIAKSELLYKLAELSKNNQNTVGAEGAFERDKTLELFCAAAGLSHTMAAYEAASIYMTTLTGEISIFQENVANGLRYYKEFLRLAQNNPNLNYWEPIHTIFTQLINEKSYFGLKGQAEATEIYNQFLSFYLWQALLNKQNEPLKDLKNHPDCIQYILKNISQLIQDQQISIASTCLESLKSLDINAGLNYAELALNSDTPDIVIQHLTNYVNSTLGIRFDDEKFSFVFNAITGIVENTQNADHHFKLAEIAGKTEALAAQELYEKAHELDPYNVKYIDALNNFYIAQNKRIASEKLLADCVKLPNFFQNGTSGLSWLRKKDTQFLEKIFNTLSVDSPQVARNFRKILIQVEKIGLLFARNYNSHEDEKEIVAIGYDIDIIQKNFGMISIQGSPKDKISLLAEHITALPGEPRQKMTVLLNLMNILDRTKNFTDSSEKALLRAKIQALAYYFSSRDKLRALRGKPESHGYGWYYYAKLIEENPSQRSTISYEPLYYYQNALKDGCIEAAKEIVRLDKDPFEILLLLFKALLKNPTNNELITVLQKFIIDKQTVLSNRKTPILTNKQDEIIIAVLTGNTNNLQKIDPQHKYRNNLGRELELAKNIVQGVNPTSDLEHEWEMIPSKVSAVTQQPTPIPAPVPPVEEKKKTLAEGIINYYNQNTPTPAAAHAEDSKQSIAEKKLTETSNYPGLFEQPKTEQTNIEKLNTEGLDNGPEKTTYSALLETELLSTSELKAAKDTAEPLKMDLEDEENTTETPNPTSSEPPEIEETKTEEKKPSPRKRIALKN